MKFEITQYSICAPVTAKQWKAMDVRDNHNRKEIPTRLEKAGAESVDYNGHFGQCIFFKVEKLEDAPKVLDALVAYLKTPLRDIPKY